MRFEEIDNILSESNAERKAVTRPLRDKYLLNQKVTPLKKIIVSNEAAKKLTMQWDKYRDPTDSLRKIMLNPDPKKGYGVNGAYGVWEAVKGNEDLYADTSKGEDGIKWSFTELWLTPEGAKKLQNNIMPLPSDFYKGESAFAAGCNTTRRRQGLKYAAEHKEEVARDMKKIGELEKAQETDDKNWEKHYDEEEKIRKQYANTGIQLYGRGNRGYSLKKKNRDSQVSNNFYNLDKKLDPYIGHGSLDKYSKEAWELVHKIGAIRDEAQKKSNSKEIASKIDKIKKEVDTFIKNHPL
jgi:hypothetical protein